MAKVLFDKVISRYGIPVVLHCDQGRSFEGAVLKELCSLLSTKKARTTAYHPQCNGLVERLNRTLLNPLGKHVSDKQKDCMGRVVANSSIRVSICQAFVNTRGSFDVWKKRRQAIDVFAEKSQSTRSYLLTMCLLCRKRGASAGMSGGCTRQTGLSQ